MDGTVRTRVKREVRLPADEELEDSHDGGDLLVSLISCSCCEQEIPGNAAPQVGLLNTQGISLPTGRVPGQGAHPHRPVGGWHGPPLILQHEAVPGVARRARQTPCRSLPSQTWSGRSPSWTSRPSEGLLSLVRLQTVNRSFRFP